MTYRYETIDSIRRELARSGNPPSSAGNGTDFTAFLCHDTEGGTGRNGAIGTIRFLIDSAYRNASYHEIWWFEETLGQCGVIQVVPITRAAHSVNPFPPDYAPDSWALESLGHDPNQQGYAVSIAGRVADVDRYSKNRVFLRFAHERFKDLQMLAPLSAVTRRVEHFRVNPVGPNLRTDWGQLLTPALGGLTIPSDLPEELSLDVSSIFEPELWTITGGADKLAPFYESPDRNSERLGFAAIGSGAITLSKAGTESKSNDWRQILIEDRLLAWIDRWDMDPIVHGTDPEYIALVKDALYRRKPENDSATDSIFDRIIALAQEGKSNG